jgi:hypothetical protein
MKHLLNGVAIVAALVIAAPASAQRTGPGAGAPGPNVAVPGGPGPSSPLSNLPQNAPGVAYPAPSAQPSAMTAPPPGGSATTSAMPPMHRHARHAAHGKMAMKHGARHAPQLAGSTANQLNQEELARLRSGNYSNPAAPPAPGTMPPAH